MPGFEIRIGIQDAAVRSAIASLGASAGDLAPAMDEIGGYLATETQLRFEQGRDPQGRSWPPSIRAQRQGGLTLVDTGRLRDSITWRADRDSVTVGSNLVYAAIHQFGGKAGRGHRTELPARPFLGVSDQDRGEIAQILREHLATPGAP